MPAAAKLAAETGVDVNALQGSGRDGRVLKEDVQNAAAKPAAAAAPAVALPAGARPEERVPMSRLRARVAERLLASQQEKRHSDYIQRSQHETNHGLACEVQRKIRERTRRKTGLHVLLR